MSDALIHAAPFPAAFAAARAKIAAFAELSKARLSALVVITAIVGFVLAGRGHSLDWVRLTATVVGATLAAFGANAFNQWLEVDHDRRMRRTRNRPLPAGELSDAEAAAFAALCSIVGPMVLLWFASVTAGLLALLTVGLYTLVYTPMKTRTVGNTFVGAIVGALPPLLGWSAAGASLLAPGAWLLAGLLFAWQIPHFLALAWLYREDYQRGGFRMLPCVDDSGRWTAWTALVYAVALLPITAGLSIVGVCGWFYGAGAVLASGGMVALAVRLVRVRSDGRARALFLGSIAYLPLVLMLMIADRVPLVGS